MPVAPGARAVPIHPTPAAFGFWAAVIPVLPAPTAIKRISIITAITVIMVTAVGTEVLMAAATAAEIAGVAAMVVAAGIKFPTRFCKRVRL